MTPRSAYFAILAEAKKKGVPVVGHVPDSVMPREAIEAGQRTIEQFVQHQPDGIQIGLVACRSPPPQLGGQVERGADCYR
jgi:hypothetical protein